MLPVILATWYIITAKRYIRTANKLQKSCTFKTTAKLLKFHTYKKAFLKQWQGIYRFSVSMKGYRHQNMNNVLEYRTALKSFKIDKPPIGHKITVWYNPTTLECYSPSDYNVAEVKKNLKVMLLICTFVMCVGIASTILLFVLK